MRELELDRHEISLMALGTVLLRNRWRLMRLMAIGAFIGGVWAFTRPPQYLASTSFASASGDQSRSALAGLAGQFGVALPAMNQSVSPEFYANLLQSRALLLPVVRDTLVVPELGGRRMAIVDLLDLPIGQGGPSAREDAAINRLRRMIAVSTSKATGVVALGAGSRWRSVSLHIATALVDGVNGFNQSTRQGQAVAERKFVEGRLAVASVELRTAEDRLRRFLETNRTIGNSAQLGIERDRIQREVSLRQQMFTSLTQSYEEARVREVRDTPVITVVESPWVPVEPEPRGLLRLLLVGIVFGFVVGGLLAMMSEMTRRRRSDGEADEFADTLQEVKAEVFRPVHWVRTRVGR